MGVVPPSPLNPFFFLKFAKYFLLNPFLLIGGGFLFLNNIISFVQVSLHTAEWDSYLKNGSWGWRGVVLVDIVSY